MSPATHVSDFFTKARARLGNKSKPETECPMCAALWCSQTGQQEMTMTMTPKKICGKCWEELICKLHHKKEYEYTMSQSGLARQWDRYKGVKTPKSRKI